MSYQKKYYFQFTSIDDKVNVVELWQNTANVLVAEEVKSMAMPFSVEMPELDHKFQVIRGTGCEINLLSDTDRKFFAGLYHTDMKEFMVKHYIDSALNWLGYLNSELVRESYSEETNYPFQITGNDGFALLERLHFLDANGDNYTGIKSKFDLLAICLKSIGLGSPDVYLSFSTTFTGQGTASDSSILHESYVDCANFYNEDGEAETMRKVLESILTPYGAFITQVSANIYITDVNTLALGTGIFKKFDLDGQYYEAVQITLTKDIADIGYMGTGSDIEMSGGKNKQVVRYSPYAFKAVLPEGLKGLNEFSGSIPGSFSSRDDGHFDYKTLTGHNKFTVFTPATFEQSFRTLGIEVAPEQQSDASVCAQWHAGTPNIKILELTSGPLLSISKGKTYDEVLPEWLGFIPGVGIKISGEVYFYRYWHSGTGDHDGGVRNVILKSVIKVGSKYGTFAYIFNEAWRGSPGSTETWFDALTYQEILIKKDDNSSISGTWIPFAGVLCNSIDLSGQLQFQLFADMDYTDDNGKIWSNTAVHHAQVRIRNLSVTLINNETGKEIGDIDLEYIGYLNKSVKEEAEKIELICGTDTTYIDRGKIMKLDSGVYSSIRQWTRNSQTYKIEELLLASLSVNYKMGYLTISNLKLKNSFNQISLITDTGLISGKKFMVKSMKINYRDNVIETSLTEVCEDSLTIVPS